MLNAEEVRKQIAMSLETSARLAEEHRTSQYGKHIASLLEDSARIAEEGRRLHVENMRLFRRNEPWYVASRLCMALVGGFVGARLVLLLLGIN